MKIDPKMFEEFGDVHEIGEFCTPEEMTMEYVEYLCAIAVENNITPTTLYLSMDLYKELSNKLNSMSRMPNPFPGGMTKIQIWTSAGQLDVEHLPHLANFAFLGTKESLEKQIWDKVGQRFEEIFLQDDT